MTKGLEIGLIFLLAILVSFSAFFSAAETAYSSVSKSKIESKVKSGKKSALLIKKHFHSFGWTLATILICNNLVNISSSALITFLFTKLMGATGAVTVISTFVMTPIIVIFGEIVPKLLAKKHAYGYLSKIAFTMEFLNIIFFPITYPLSKIALQSKITNSETELKSLIKIAKKEGVLEKDEAELAVNALDLDSTTVAKILTKKTDIISVNNKATIGDALNIFKKYGFSRLPIWDGEKYSGLIILKDIFLAPKKDLVEDYLVEIRNVSQHSLVTNALEQMRMLKSYLLLVTKTQESKKVLGIITIEDIIEELVGEIYDEHDEEHPIRQISLNKWTIVGSTRIDLVQKELEIELDFSNENDTFKQWIQSRIQRKIKKNLKYKYKDQLKLKIISNRNNEETLIEVVKK